MRPRRYTILVADRSSGLVRRLTINLRPTLAAVVVVLVIPVLIGAAFRWSAERQIAQLKATQDMLEVENGSYRAATGELTTQLQSLEGVINELGERATVDPAEVRAMQKLPAVVKARAAGGAVSGSLAVTPIPSAMSTPEDTFDVLHDLLHALEGRLSLVRSQVERREALAAATPSIWPARGWLTGTFGGRSDPFTHEPGFHEGLDISTEQGQPVYATADGTVETAAYTGDYGNLVILRHGFGLSTRYGHLSKFNVKVGDQVKRGDVIGFVGATGRATGSHVHYEILANGRPIDPLRILTQPTLRAN
jgi:murein DD-endopeptidase MepM/ murein hydrolase activator NlpD